MSTKYINIIIVYLLFVIYSTSFAQTGHKEMFEKAKYTMETKGDLKSAISLFEDLIQKYPAVTEYSAKSQFYIGLCYEKLGKKEAQKAYEKVINNYPNQTKIVNLAKEKLSAMKTVPRKLAKEPKGLQLQQVWAKPYDTMGQPSPDGRYMSYVNWNVPCLAIYEISTGEAKDINSTKGTWEGDMQYAESSIWSPDGKKLAYVWYDKKGVSLRTVGINSSDPVELLRDPKLIYCHPCSWSSDGKFLLSVLCHKDHGHEIVLISLTDHSVRSLKKLKAGHHPWAVLSPDGKFVAYSYIPDMNSPETDIYLLSTIDDTEKTLVDHPATDYSPLWMPDGKNIIFFSDRTGSVSAWSQKISDGTPVGEEKLIKHLNRLFPKTITSNGDLFISFLEGGYNVCNAILDPETGKVIASPKRVVETNVGWNGGACYSPDGKKMAYVSQRGVLNADFSWGQQSLIIRDLQSGVENELNPTLQKILRGRVPLKWSPDSDEILLVGLDKTGPPGQYILNIHDTSYVSITGQNDLIYGDVIWARNSSKFYSIYRGEIEKNGIYSIDRHSQKATKILSEKNIYGLTLHPNSNKLAIVADKVIKLINLDTNEPEEFYELQPDVKHSYIHWAPDGKWLYFTKCLGKKTMELWRIDEEGNNVQLIDDSFPHMENLSIHPEGRKMVFTVGKGGGNSSIWVMKNFLQDEKANK